MIRKVGNEYVLYSKSSGRRLGTAKTKKEIEKREKQVNYFKHKKK